MTDINVLEARVQQLTRRSWDIPAIQARYQKLRESGFPRKSLDRREIIAHKERILDRVQFRAEEYEYFSRN